MPFESIYEVPSGAKWQELGISGKAKVYELLWTKQGNNGIEMYVMWRGLIERETNRPLRTEFYSRDSNSSEYEMRTVNTIEYWTDSQIQELFP